MSTLVDETLVIDTPDGPALLGSRCADCSAYTFPRQQGCPRCTRESMVDIPLSRTGTLWTFTVQGFRPKEPYAGPTDFEPFGVGYVELPGEVIVETRLTVADPDLLRIGMPMRMVLVPFRTGDDGEPVSTFAFAPDRGEEATR